MNSIEETQQNNLTTGDIILRYGLVCGGFYILVIAILYMIDAALIFGAFAYIGLVGIFVISVLAAVKKKDSNGGLISYGESVTVSIASFSIGLTIYTLFMLLLYFVIDPSLIARMKSVQLAKMDQYMAKGSLTKEQYKAAADGIEKIDSKTILFYSIGGLLVFILLSMIVFLLTSIFIKKDSPFKNSPA